MRDDKWVRRWVVPSSSGDGEYIVGQDAEGNYGCSCPAWTRNVIHRCPKCQGALGRFSKTDKPGIYWCFACKEEVTPVTERRDCRHIQDVKDGRAQTLAEATLDKLAGG